MKVMVEKDFNRKYGLYFDIRDVKEACKKNGCSRKLREECFEKFLRGRNTCMRCFIYLCSQRILPEVRKLKKEEK